MPFTTWIPEGVIIWQWSTFWTAFGALATMVAVFTIFFAGRQLRLDAWVRVQEIFVKRNFVNARTRVFRHLHDPHLVWDAKDEEAGLEVCRRMDEVCRLADYFSFIPYIGKRKFLKVFEDSLGKSWALLRLLVMAERDKVEWNTKWDAFEKLGGAALNRLPKGKQEKLMKHAERLGPRIKELRTPELKSVSPAMPETTRT